VRRLIGNFPESRVEKVSKKIGEDGEEEKCLRNIPKYQVRKRNHEPLVFQGDNYIDSGFELQREDDQLGSSFDPVEFEPLIR
jgi:hypothetical protein